MRGRVRRARRGASPSRRPREQWGLNEGPRRIGEMTRGGRVPRAFDAPPTQFSPGMPFSLSLRARRAGVRGIVWRKRKAVQRALPNVCNLDRRLARPDRAIRRGRIVRLSRGAVCENSLQM